MLGENVCAMFTNDRDWRKKLNTCIPLPHIEYQARGLYVASTENDISSVVAH